MNRILVVDDNPDVLVSMRLLLECVGYQVDTASNGREGLRRYREKHPAVVITDLAMPEMDGVQFMERLRREDPAARIIAVSGFSASQQRAYLAGRSALATVDTFVKPVEAGRLLSRVQELIGAPAERRGDAYKRAQQERAA